MVSVLLRPIEGAEFAIDVANIGVIDVAINDLGDDLAPPMILIFFLREVAARVRQHP